MLVDRAEGLSPSVAPHLRAGRQVAGRIGQRGTLRPLGRRTVYVGPPSLPVGAPRRLRGSSRGRLWSRMCASLRLQRCMLHVSLLSLKVEDGSWDRRLASRSRHHRITRTACGQTSRCDSRGRKAATEEQLRQPSPAAALLVTAASRAVNAAAPRGGRPPHPREGTLRPRPSTPGHDHQPCRHAVPRPGAGVHTRHRPAFNPPNNL